MTMQPLLRSFALMLVIALASCAAPSRPGDPSIASKAPRTDLATASEVRLHRFSAKGARIPDEAFAAAITTIERRIHRPIRVIDHGEFATGWGDGGQMAPIHDRGAPVAAKQVLAAPERSYRLQQNDNGIVGLTLHTDVSSSTLSSDELVERVPVIPLLEPGTLIVVELGGSPDGGGVTGVASRVAIDSPTGMERRTGMVVLSHSAIRKRSGFFVNTSKLSQWTLAHELGHCLGVPASNTHIWQVPGLGEHCTNSACIMYTGFDWRVLWTGLVRGWPLDFCGQCSAEIESANPAPQGPGS